MSTSDLSFAKEKYELASLLVERENFQDAISAYTEAENGGIDYPALYLRRGFCYDKLGKSDLAINDFIKSCKLAPWDSRGFFNLGLMYDQKEMYEEAIKVYDKAIELNLERSYVDMATIYYQRASARHFKIKNESPSLPTTLILKSFALNDVTKAIELSKNPTADYYYLKGCLLFDSLNRGEARIAWKMGAELGDLECKKLLLEYQDEDVHQGSLTKTLFDYSKEKFADEYSNQRRAEECYVRGNKEWTRKEYTKSYDSFSEAIRLKPDFALAYIGRARSTFNSIFERNTQKENRADCDKATELLKCNYQELYREAIEKHKAREDSAAIKYYTLTIESFCQKMDEIVNWNFDYYWADIIAECYYSLGSIYQHLGDKEKACDNYLKAKLGGMNENLAEDLELYCDMVVMEKVNNVQQVLGNWQVLGNDKIVFKINLKNGEKILMNHLINNSSVNTESGFDFSFDEFHQLRLESYSDLYVISEISEGMYFMTINRMIGENSIRYSLKLLNR